jgi:hypothetical protein
MSHINCVYYAFPLDANGDASSDKELHSSVRVAPEEEPADEDPAHRPQQSASHSERRHRPWPYYQC